VRLKSIILICIFSSVAYSQTDSSRIFKTHSIQFRTSNLLSLSSFKGSFVSYKYQPKDDYAYRFGISLNGRNTVENENIDSYQYSDSSFLDQKRNSNYALIEVVAEYLKYFNLKEELKMFFGFGPRIYFSINNSDTDKVQSENYNYYKERKDNYYQFGLSFSYGLEWFFRENMSLHAEYGINFSYIYNESKIWRIYPDDSDSDRFSKTSEVNKGFEINDTSALLGLSLYF